MNVLPSAIFRLSLVSSCYELRLGKSGVTVIGIHPADMAVLMAHLNSVGESTNAGANCSSDHTIKLSFPGLSLTQNKNLEDSFVNT